MNCEHKLKISDTCELCGGIYIGCNDCGALMMACVCGYSGDVSTALAEADTTEDNPQNINSQMTDAIKQTEYDLSRYEKLAAELGRQNTLLRESLVLALSYFEGHWADTNNHPASHYADYVHDIKAALRGE